MRFLKWTTLGALVAVLGATATAQSRNPLYVDMPYEVVPDHFKPDFPKGWTWGTLMGVYAESPARIYIYQWGILPILEKFVGPDGMPIRDVSGTIAKDNSRNPIDYLKVQRKEYVLTVFDRNGKMIEHWKELDALADRAHRIKVNPWDPEKHVWLVDEGEKGQLFKMTRTGNIAMRVGSEKGTGCYRAQDIAFLPDGDFWCLEGFTSGKVVKFSKDGKRLTEFGKLGSGPGELDRAHAITIDRRGRIYIGDRGNYRIQVFDQNGKFLQTLPEIWASSMGIDRDNRLWVVCSVDNCGANKASHGLTAYDADGKPLFTWGVAGGLPGQLYGLSQVDVDSQGNVYMVEVRGGRAQMFRPKKNADPKHLIKFPFTGGGVPW